ncbi:MAG: aminotransferase class V-fold PLP-dependent enzyme, partial [Candidatus Eisenbacteria bacterium]|nr:aminotransferase class V-fold PLP-dependent enzyme [Candidatus Eisenbacteria bacterium]
SDPQEIVMEVDKAKVGIRWGHFNAPRLLDSMGYLEYKGVIRASLAHYNTVDEIERLKKALDPLVS